MLMTDGPKYSFDLANLKLVGHPVMSHKGISIRNATVDDVSFPYDGEYQIVDFNAKNVMTHQSVKFATKGVAFEFVSAVNSLAARG